MKRLRLVKVLVQPVFVLDDGETVTEVEHGVITVPAADWPTYGERFAHETAEWEASLNVEPNRAERRRKRS